MENEVLIANAPIEITTAPGIRIPVVVENKLNEPVPVEVKNNPEIHGTVHLDPNTTIKTKAPAFLAQGAEYTFSWIAGMVPGLPDTFKNPVRIRDIDYYPWVFVEHVSGPPRDQHTQPALWINVGLIAAIKDYKA